MVLQRAGSLSGSLLVDPGIPVENFRVETAWKRDELPKLNLWDIFHGGTYFTPKRVFVRAAVKKDGAFLWKQLPPGRTDVRILLPGREEPFLRVRDVSILPGKDCKDPRLRKIDLRGGIGVLRLEVSDKEGKKVKKARLFFGKEYGPSVSIHPGKRIFFLPGRYERALVKARAYRFAWFRLAPGVNEEKVVLEKGIPIEIVYEGTKSIPPPPTEVGFYLDHEPEKDAPSSFYTLECTPRAVLGPDLRARALLPRPGIYKGLWFREGKSMHGISGSEVRLRVEDKDTLQVFHGGEG